MNENGAQSRPAHCESSPPRFIIICRQPAVYWVPSVLAAGFWLRLFFCGRDRDSVTVTSGEFRRRCVREKFFSPVRANPLLATDRISAKRRRFKPARLSLRNDESNFLEGL